jgi:hypothetical protein
MPEERQGSLILCWLASLDSVVCMHKEFDVERLVIEVGSPSLNRRARNGTTVWLPRQDFHSLLSFSRPE